MRTLALCGHSVAFACVEASLCKRPGIRVVPAHEIDVDLPDVVVFEMTTCPFDSLVSFWKKQPRVLMVRLSFLEGEALKISSHAVRVSTVEDLIQVIEGQNNEPRGTENE